MPLPNSLKVGYQVRFLDVAQCEHFIFPFHSHRDHFAFDSFDDALFALLVERIIAESQMTIRFQLYGGLEFTETLEER